MYISVKNIYKRFSFGKDLINVINGATYSFKSGSIYAISGNSGSGKSTFLNLVGLLDYCSEGSIIYDGVDVSKLSNNERTIYRRKNIGFVFQNFNLINNLSCFDNVMIPLLVNNELTKREASDKVKELLDSVNMIKRSEHYPTTLSGGEQQRTAIARALVNGPSVLLADEPTGNVDKDSEKAILETFRKLSDSGKVVIIVTHSDRVKEYADYECRLEEGRLIGNGEN